MQLIKAPFGKHIVCLDGVRGIAILLVMCAHLMPSQPIGFVPLEYVRKVFEAGWIGVDLFFVLSGFLITGILLDSRGRAHALRNFYARRSLRIFPLYFAVLIGGLLLLPALGYTYEGQKATESNQLWLWTYTTNLFIASEQSYFFTADGLKLAHLWSLAVEEHFYLAWPLAVLYLPVRRLVGISLSIILGALLIRCVIYLNGSAGLTNYVLTVCRMDSLMFGSVLALGTRLPSATRQLRSILAVGGAISGCLLALIMLTTKGWWIEHWTMQTIGFSLLGIFFTACLYFLLHARETHISTRLVSTAPLRFLGKYAYGLYIFNSILDPHLERVIPNNLAPIGEIPIVGPIGILALRIALVIPVAMLSYHLLEAPFLKLKVRFNNLSGDSMQRHSAPSCSMG